MVPDVTSATSKVDPSAKTKALDDKTRAKLQKAVHDFEAIFVNYMLQNMRKSVQKSDEETSDFGGDMMQGMFDLEIAKHVSQKSNLGIGEMLYKQLTGENIPKTSPQSTGRAVSVPDHGKAPAPKVDSSATTFPKRLDQYQSMIQDASGKFGVDPNLIKAVIAAESAGNPRAISSKSAKGLMQLIDSTATSMGVKDVWNPQQNILGGSKYLKQLLDKFDGDTTLAVASYNAGPHAVEKHKGVPPFTETKQYVNRVMNYMRLFEQQESAE